MTYSPTLLLVDIYLIIINHFIQYNCNYSADILFDFIISIHLLNYN